MSALTFQALRQLADGRFHSGEDVARERPNAREMSSPEWKRPSARRRSARNVRALIPARKE